MPRAPRVIKSPVTTPVVVETTSDVQPVVESTVVDSAVVESTVVDTAGQSAVENNTKTRTFSNKKNGVYISPSRTRRFLDKMCVNLNVNNSYNELKTQLAAHEALIAKLQNCEDDEEKAHLQTQIDAGSALAEELHTKLVAIGHERTRFSADSSVTLSIVCDELVKQLVEFSAKNTLLLGKKIIQVSHLYHGGYEELSLYPLFKSLPEFMVHAEAIRASDNACLLEQTLAQAEKQFKKKYNVKVPKKPATVVVEAETQPAEPTTQVVEVDAQPAEPTTQADAQVTDDDVHLSDSGEEVIKKASHLVTFKYYVSQLCSLVTSKDAYNKVSVSNAFKEYLSTLVIEFINRVGRLVPLTAASMKNRTINHSSILRTIEYMMCDGLLLDETITFAEADVVDPVALKAAKSKAAADKLDGVESKLDVSGLPTVRGVVACRLSTYVGSGYYELHDHVLRALHDYDYEEPEITE